MRMLSYWLHVLAAIFRFWRHEINILICIKHVIILRLPSVLQLIHLLDWCRSGGSKQNKRGSMSCMSCLVSNFTFTEQNTFWLVELKAHKYLSAYCTEPLCDRCFFPHPSRFFFFFVSGREFICSWKIYNICLGDNDSEQSAHTHTHTQLRLTNPLFCWDPVLILFFLYFSPCL